MNVGPINAKAANGKLANTLLTEFAQGFLGAALNDIGIDGTKHSNDFFVILAFDDELGQLWAGGCNLLQVNFL